MVQQVLSVSRDRVLVPVLRSVTHTSVWARVWAREFSRSFGLLTGRPCHSGRVVGPITVEQPDGYFSAADRDGQYLCLFAVQCLWFVCVLCSVCRDDHRHHHVGVCQS